MPPRAITFMYLGCGLDLHRTFLPFQDASWISRGRPVEKATFSIHIHIPSACTSSHACIYLPSSTNKRANEKNADFQKQSLALASSNQRISTKKKKKLPDIVVNMASHDLHEDVYRRNIIFIPAAGWSVTGAVNNSRAATQSRE